MESVQNKIVKAALLGAGTVGSGVYELVKERQEDFPHICGTQIEIAKILVRDASKEREGIPSELLTDNWKEIIADDSISIIIEVMGGIEPAKSYLPCKGTSNRQRSKRRVSWFYSCLFCRRSTLLYGYF